VPTTLLSQIDSSVGGKVGINSEFGKNTIGAFHQPAGVLIDTSTLKTLPKRELTAGFCEAVKHGILAGPRLFDKTHKFLRQRDAGGPLTEAEYSPLAELILDQVKFKASIVAGDEHEKASRSDARSRKILNFGHTVGHALEKATNYRYFRHGEAVGYGIMAAAEISKNIGILDSNVVTLLNDVVHLSGKLPVADKIDAGEVCKLVLLDKKSDGESLQWILVEAIGKPVIVSNDELEKKLVLASVKAVLRSA
jgi:3-dehydroquinate synthase